jgi:hypothetical protein
MTFQKKECGMNHKTAISASGYFKNKKGLRKLAHEINFYKTKNVEIELDFSNESIKSSDLIYFFKRVKLTYKKLMSMVKVAQFDQFQFSDIAYGILNRSKIKSITITCAVILVSLGLIGFGAKYSFDNYKVYCNELVVKNKMYALIDKYKMKKNLEDYYASKNVASRNNNRNLDQTLNLVAKSIVKNSKKLNVPEDVVIAVIWNESNISKYAISKLKKVDKYGNVYYIKCAYGYNQIYLDLWKGIIPLDNAEVIFDEDANIYLGCYVLRNAFDIAGENNTFGALMKYNGGYEVIGNETAYMNTETFVYVQKILNDISYLDKMKKGFIDVL